MNNLKWLCKHDRDAVLDCMVCGDCEECGFSLYAEAFDLTNTSGACVRESVREWLLEKSLESGTADAWHDLRFLRKRGVTDFVHLTAAENLRSILEFGLLPRFILKECDLVYIPMDKLRLEGDDAINLSITNPNIRLLYRKRQEYPSRVFAALTLDPALLACADIGYAFTSTNAASDNAEECRVKKVFKGNRPAYFERNWPTDNQAEVLVRGRIDPKFIRAIQFPYSDRQNPKAVRIAKKTAWKIDRLRLSCEALFSDRLFYYNELFLGESDALYNNTPRDWKVAYVKRR